jgi:hypothetical protein
LRRPPAGAKLSYTIGRRARIISDGHGGVILIAPDARGGEEYFHDRIRVQRISHDGERLWGDVGLQPTISESLAFNPDTNIILDENGGLFLVYSYFDDALTRTIINGNWVQADGTVIFGQGKELLVDVPDKEDYAVDKILYFFDNELFISLDDWPDKACIISYDYQFERTDLEPLIYYGESAVINSLGIFSDIIKINEEEFVIVNIFVGNQEDNILNCPLDSSGFAFECYTYEIYNVSSGYLFGSETGELLDFPVKVRGQYFIREIPEENLYEILSFDSGIGYKYNYESQSLSLIFPEEGIGVGGGEVAPDRLGGIYTSYRSYIQTIRQCLVDNEYEVCCPENDSCPQYIWLQHMNSDGSISFPEDVGIIHFAGGWSGWNPCTVLVESTNENVIVLWRHPLVYEGTYVPDTQSYEKGYYICAQKYNTNANPLWDEEPCVKISQILYEDHFSYVNCDQQEAQWFGAVADGDGGVIVAFYDKDTNLWVQRISSDGLLLWDNR